MKSKFKINNIIGSAVFVAIIFANIAPVAVYADDYGDSGYSDSSYSYGSGYGDSSYDYGSGYTDSSYNYGSGYTDSNYNYGSGYTDSNYNYGNSGYTDSSYNYGSGYTDSNYNYGSSPYTNSSYNYSQPVYTTTQAQSVAQGFAQTYSQPSYSQPSYSQPRVSAPSYSQLRYSTPTYSQPRYSTPAYTPVYIAQQTPTTPIYYPTPTPTPTPINNTCTINIVPIYTNISAGNSVNISWNSTNASYVVLNGGTYNNVRVANSGTYSVRPTVSTTYTVRCYTAQGQSNSASSYITVSSINNNYCTNGATNYPYCNNNVNNNYCANGATNYPTCTYPQNYYCTNGATNYPYCNNNVNNNYVWCNGVSYPAGYVCPTVNQNNLDVSTTGATAYNTTATLYGYVNPFGSSATIWFDYGTNPNNLQWQTTKQNTSYAGQFSGNLSGLACSTRYYYRAAAQNSYTTKYGSTLSFVTPACGGNGGVYTADNSVVTRLATSVSYYNGQLNGAFVKGNQTTNSCQSYFDYGTSYNLGTRTGAQSLYPNYTVNYFSRAVSNLTPNTTYYVRAVVTCSTGTKYGNIVSFKTPAIKYTYVGKKKTVYNYNYVAPKTEVTPTPTCMCDTQSYLSLVVENMDSTATIGKYVNYKIVYKNTSKENLKDVAIRVVLPEEMTINSSEKGQFTKGGNTLVYTIPSLKSLEGGSFILTAVVDKNTTAGRQMVVNSYANYTVPTVVKSGVALTGEVTTYIVSIADNGTSLNPGNDNTDVSTSTSTWPSWLPSNVIDWVIFIIVFLIFLAALRYVFGAVKKAE